MNNTLDAAFVRAETPADAYDIQRQIAEAVRAATAAQAFEASRPAQAGQGVVLELDRAQFARAVYRSHADEQRRVGVNLTGGGR